MVAINSRHFFVYELTILANNSVVMPYCWFLHDGSIMACTWPLCAVSHLNNLGWIVKEFKMVIISQDDLSIQFGYWAAGQLAHTLPCAKFIFGMFTPVTLI